MAPQTHWSDVIELLADPIDRSPLVHDAATDSLRSESGNRYDIVDGQPVLLGSGHRVSGSWRFPPVLAGQQEDIRTTTGWRSRSVARLRRLVRGGQGSPSVIEPIERALGERDGRPTTVLIVGGGSVGHGSAGLHELPNARVLSFDVYPSPATTFVADGHQIPMADESVDVVWIQAVLEHVVEPAVVVAEIARVLAPGGLVYAETPFLQPVHEGPYDFMRFTHSGHRLLFAGFDEIESDVIGGPGAMAALAARGVAGGLTRSRRIGRLVFAATAWLGLLDRAVPPEWRSDFATGVRFLGRKPTQRTLADFDSINYYRGAQ